MPVPLAAPGKLAKWRKFLASWQLGTPPAADGEYRTGRREQAVPLRCEVSALTRLLLLQKGVFTQREWQAAVDADVHRERQHGQAADGLVRDILESLCQRDGLSLDSAVEPGEPARNCELAGRLGIGHVFGLREEPG